MTTKQYWNLLINRNAGEKGKRIHFLVPNFHIGSAITRGCQISGQLNKLGIYSRVFELDYRPKKLEQVKDSIFIIVKAASQNSADIFSILKKNGNILIWDPLDSLVELRSDPEARMFDGVIFMNDQCIGETADYFRKDCRYGVVPHHWDKRCRVNHASRYKLLYFGDTTPENIAPEHIREIKNLHCLRCNSEQLFIDLLQEIRDYNCHFSVREDHSESFKYKPAVKLSFASATDSNIILSRDYSNLELLDASYPYYTSGDLKSVKEAVAYSKETYGSKIWESALDMIRKVRKRTSIESVCRDYIQLAKCF